MPVPPDTHETSEEGREVGLQVPVRWVGADDMPVLLANQFAIQHDQDEFTLSIGRVTPPLLIGPSDEQVRQAKALDFVPVRVIGRYAMTRPRLESLIELLQRHVRRLDEGDDQQGGQET